MTGKDYMRLFLRPHHAVNHTLTPVPAILLSAITLGFLIFLPQIVSGYIVYIANLLGVYVILALGLNILIGDTGQFGLAHVAFYGVGIYATALLCDAAGLPFYLSLICASLLAAAMGFIIGISSLRMRDIYLALSTFAFGEAMQWVFLNWDSLTQGPNGLRISPTTILGIQIVSDHQAYYFVLGLTLLFVVLTIAISRSRLGRSFRAVRESEMAAQAVGINLRMTKTIAFTLSAFYAGAAGGVFTIYSSYIHPDSLGFELTIMVLTMIVVGGLGSIGGAIIGALFLGILSEILRQALSWQEIIYGIILIIFMMYLPMGLWGLYRSVLPARK